MGCITLKIAMNLIKKTRGNLSEILLGSIWYDENSRELRSCNL